MGIQAPQDYTAPIQEPTPDPIIWVDCAWDVYQSKEGVAHLIWNGKDGEFHMSNQLFRFNRARPVRKSVIVLSWARAYDVDGKVYLLGGPRAEPDWAKAYWTSFWEKVSMSTEFTRVETGFYLEELGKPWQDKRVHIGKTPSTELGTDHRHYNISHIRINLGMRGETAWGMIGCEIDLLLGATLKFNKRTGEEIPPTIRLSSRGGVTLAYTMVPDGLDMVKVVYAISVCSPKDRYDRKIGAAAVVKKLETALEAVKTPGIVLSLIHKAKSGLGYLMGIGQTTMRIPHSCIRPTSVTKSTPYYEFVSPFFPAGKVMQYLLLETIMDELDAEFFHETSELVYTKSLERICGVVEASFITLGLKLKTEAGLADPNSFFEDKFLKVEPAPEVPGTAIPQYAKAEVVTAALAVELGTTKDKFDEESSATLPGSSGEEPLPPFSALPGFDGAKVVEPEEVVEPAAVEAAATLLAVQDPPPDDSVFGG